VLEAFPEDLFAGLLGKCVGSGATARGDEVEYVIAIPMLEAVLRSEIFFALMGTFADHRAYGAVT
jgi:hypothetical protein